MRTQSIKANSSSDIKTQIEFEIKNGFQPTLAIVFISNEAELKPLLSILTDKQIRVFGSSAGDPFVDGESGYASITVLFLDLDPSAFAIKLMEGKPSSYTLLAEKIRNTGTDEFDHASYLIVAGGLMINSEDVVDGFESSGHSGKINMFGGFASDNLKLERVFVFTNDQVADEGILALIFDESKIRLSGLAFGGWQPFGSEKTITKSEGTVIYTIDNEPALDFISRYSGISKEKFQNDSPAAVALSSNFQFMWMRPDKYPVMRPPMYVNQADGSIVVGGLLPEGSKVKLCLMPGTDVIESAVSKFKELKNREPDAECLILFSCAARRLSLGPSIGEEIEKINKIWSVPMVGFFSYAEMGTTINNTLEAHSMTCSLALLKEVKA